MSALVRRLKALEAAAGGSCPKHAGVLLTFVNGTLRTAARHGGPMPAAERAEFEAAGSRCPACGVEFLHIRVPSEIPDPQSSGSPGPPRQGVTAPAFLPS